MLSLLASHESAGLATVFWRLPGLGFLSPAARARRARYRRTLGELEQMSARELAELGLHRCDIRRVAREAATFG